MAEKTHLSQLRTLLGQCNNTTVEILLEATSLCKRLGHQEIILEHFLDCALEKPGCDVVHISRHFGLEPDSFRKEVHSFLNQQKAIGSPRPPMSGDMVEVLEKAWHRASLVTKTNFVRSGDVFWAMLDAKPSVVSRPMRMLRKSIIIKELEDDFGKLTSHTTEELTSVEPQPGLAPAASSGAGAAGSATGAAGSPQDSSQANSSEGGFLAKYCTNFTLLAEEGKLDPIFGRDAEIREAIDILARRRKNNPILVGEPGVGKTAIVEGLALRIIQGDVPANFANFQVIGLDLGLMQAGASVKGEFEKRLTGVIKEIKESPVPTIFFIDEAHTLIGAGGAAGGSDAANLLKPALARGELRSVAATTWSEYKQYFETDPALTRRFQLIKIDEPSLDDAKTMLRGLRGKYEDAHGLRILDSAVDAAVECAKRYISGRFLPDSAIDLIDTACAKIKNVLQSKPPAIDQLERDLADLEIERNSITREVEEGRPESKRRLADADKRREALTAELENLREQWQVERIKVDEIHAVAGKIAVAREELEAARLDQNFELVASIESTELHELSETLGKHVDELKALQGENALLHAEVDGDTVRTIVGQWTGVPVQKMAAADASIASGMKQLLGAKIKGQEFAIHAVSEALKAHKAGIADPNRPIGVFLCLGPSGVGKTEMAMAVADLMFGGEDFVSKINMSEYSSGFSESRLIGAPPGYKGYGKGGVLTEAVRKKPYSVVLLDEVDRADARVWNLFYSPFERGEMNDGEGKTINFRNTCIFLTSNLGSEAILKWDEMRIERDEQLAAEGAAGSSEVQDSESPDENEMDEQLTLDALIGYLKEEAGKAFTMPLLARMTVLPFIPLDAGALQEITMLKLKKVQKQLMEQRELTLNWADEVPEWIVDRCDTAGFGARLIDQIISAELMPELTNGLLASLAKGETPHNVSVQVVGVGEDSSLKLEVS